VRITALDLAAISGLCYGELPVKPAFLSIDLRKEPGGRGGRGTALMRFLAKHIDTYHPEIIFIEAPMDAHVAAKVGATPDTMIALNGYVMLAETVAYSRRVPTELLHVQDARKHFVGVRSFPDKNEGKRAVFARCKQLGWEPPNLDCSDAACLWDYGSSQHTPGFARLASDRPMQPVLAPPPARAT
jgi:hypothetical protein